MSIAALSALLNRYCHSTITPTAISRLTLSRSSVITAPLAVMYHPLLCVVAQGRKRVFLNEESFEYNPATYLISSLDLPVTGQIIEAPCVGLTLAINQELLATLLLEMPGAPEDRSPPAKAMRANALGDDLLEPLLRLLGLLERPEDIPVLFPLIEREIHYRLLLGPQGENLRQLARPASRFSQVGRAINAIRQRYNEPLRIEELARIAGMSAPSLHRHFRTMTAMSPLQFQKRIRLQEARRLLLSRDLDATRVSFDVGYESPSQFSREYRRLFGVPPARDAADARRFAAAV